MSENFQSLGGAVWNGADFDAEKKKKQEEEKQEEQAIVEEAGDEGGDILAESLESQLKKQESAVDEKKEGSLGEEKGKKKLVTGALIVVIFGVLVGCVIFTVTKIMKPGLNLESRPESQGVKMPETDEEILVVAKGAIEGQTNSKAEGLKILKKDTEKGLVWVSYENGSSIINYIGVKPEVLTAGKDAKDFEALYGGGKVSEDFLHGKFEDRVYMTLAKQFEGGDVEKAKNRFVISKVADIEGEKSEFVTLGLGDKSGGGFLAFMKKNAKNGKYDWMCGGQAVDIACLEKLKENGFPEKNWKKALEDAKSDLKKKEEEEKKKKEEEEKKKKKEEEDKKNAEIRKKNVGMSENDKIYVALATFYNEPLERFKKNSRIERVVKEGTDGEFVIVSIGAIQEDGQRFGGHVEFMYYHKNVDRYERVAGGHAVDSAGELRMQQLKFPEKYWRNTEKANKGGNNGSEVVNEGEKPLKKS